MRTELKAVRLDQAGVSCSAVQVIDSAVGGGAARADLGVDSRATPSRSGGSSKAAVPTRLRSNIAINRFDGATGAWASAVFAETQPGNAISPRASATVARRCSGGSRPRAVSTASRRCCNH